MQEEMNSLFKNNTYELVEIPKGRKALRNKWVFKLKKDGEMLLKYKAYLVVKGFGQKKGIDFDEIFSPVLKMTSMDLELEQRDVKTTFLHKDLEEEIYVQQPQGFEIKGKEQPGVQVKEKPLRPQANTIASHGYKRTVANHCVYLRKFSDGNFIVLLLYVDDMLITGQDVNLICRLKEELSKSFDMKDLGPAQHILVDLAWGNNFIWGKHSNNLLGTFTVFYLKIGTKRNTFLLVPSWAYLCAACAKFSGCHSTLSCPSPLEYSQLTSIGGSFVSMHGSSVTLLFLLGSQMHLQKELLGNATHAETAREVWKDLEERFTQGIAPRVYELKRAVVLLQQEKASVASYYGTLKSVWGELQVRSQILSIDPLPNIGRAYAIVAQEEKQRSIAASRTPTIEAAALLTKKSDSQMRWNGSGRRNQFPPCPHCGKTNHSQEYCFKVIGYPSDWRKPGKGNSSRADHKQTNSSNAAFTSKMDGENLLIPGLTPSQQQQLMALLNGQEVPGGNPSANMATSNFSGKTENEWIVDTGATNHITHDVNSLSNVEQQHDIPPVQIPDGKTVPVHALGQITIGKRLILDQVLGVPEFCFNLIKPRDKFAPRAKPGIFVGYPNGQKGYRIYDLESKRIYVSRDVQFLEGIYPYTKSSLGESRQVSNEEPDAGNIPLSTDLCTDPVEEPVMESIATEPISPDIEVGCSESDESDPTVENQQAATLPSKRQRHVSRFLSGYQYVLPPSLAPVETNTPPSSPSANSTASRNWYKKFTAALLAIGFRQSTADYSLFTFTLGGSFVAVLVHVDDVIIIGTDSNHICKLKNYLDTKFHIKNLGKLKYFLGIEVARSPAGIFLSQRKYVLDILAECGLTGCKPASFPMEQQHKLSNESGEICKNPEEYRRLVGRLLYLNITRPNISYAVHILNQFMHDPRQPHLDAAYRVLHYLKGSPVSWRAKKQTVVSRSSAEAEYRAMATTTSEIIWLK
ncbi:hypothetical protein RJ639_030783 [Escallonia herrerae]|uniref:Reverse transcriptase Ty1/copia-type domain-containing protein n=1 Tax=Escallonia herrerae TaxID=1293975 RepID=A0AA89BLR3_9ASTE|nr:hypothetical protein RJ639_030783 [Escallonia herrerae]